MASGHEVEFGNQVDLDWSAIKNLGSYGPGLLASADEEADRILIWLNK